MVTRISCGGGDSQPEYGWRRALRHMDPEYRITEGHAVFDGDTGV